MNETSVKAFKELSPREVQIVDLCVTGLTNEAIAHALEISVGTVNTYWLRIKFKVGGSGRADTVARIIKERAAEVLHNAELRQEELADLIARREQCVVELRAALALLHLACSSCSRWFGQRDLISPCI